MPFKTATHLRLTVDKACQLPYHTHQLRKQLPEAQKYNTESSNNRMQQDKQLVWQHGY
jgi:hypothetical protein